MRLNWVDTMYYSLMTQHKNNRIAGFSLLAIPPLTTSNAFRLLRKAVISSSSSISSYSSSRESYETITIGQISTERQEISIRKNRISWIVREIRSFDIVNWDQQGRGAHERRAVTEVLKNPPERACHREVTSWAVTFPIQIRSPIWNRSHSTRRL